MRRAHFAAFAPHCPVCAARDAGQPPLVLAAALVEQADDILAGILHCANPGCRHEYPIIDGIPIIVPRLRPLLAERGIDLLLRQDVHPALESLIGDALGPDTWFDALRQSLSSYGWDGWADLDPEEAPCAPGSAPGGATGPLPGAARRCLARLLELAAEPGAPVARAAPAGQVLDLGCAGGRTTFDLAATEPGALVLGVDTALGLLRLARGAIAGRIEYSRRRIGVVYDRRRFSVAPAHAERVDFWACDALALPFAAGRADLVAALNLLDCVADPLQLLRGMATALREGGRLLLATPYDWSPRATPPEGWIGGHSQRADAASGRGEPTLRILLDDAAHPRAVAGLRLLGEEPNWPWHTRLHDRAAVQYRTHLLALRRVARPNIATGDQNRRSATDKPQGDSCEHPEDDADPAHAHREIQRQEARPTSTGLPQAALDSSCA